jgi:hypothetical protein
MAYSWTLGANSQTTTTGVSIGSGTVVNFNVGSVSSVPQGLTVSRSGNSIAYSVKLKSNGGLDFDKADGSVGLVDCQNNQILKYDSTSHNWSCASSRHMISGSSTGQTLVSNPTTVDVGYNGTWNWQIFRDDSNLNSDFVTATYDTGLVECAAYRLLPDGYAFYCSRGGIRLPNITGGGFPGFYSDHKIVVQPAAIDVSQNYQFSAQLDGVANPANPTTLIVVNVSGYTHIDGSQDNIGQDSTNCPGTEGANVTIPSGTRSRCVRMQVTLTGRTNKLAW